MALRGVSRNQVIEYISPQDPCKTREEGATVWKLGLLDVDVQAQITDSHLSMTQEDGQPGRLQVGTNHRNLDFVRFGLREVENFLHPETGNALVPQFRKIKKFGKDYTIVDDQFISFLSSALINELGNKIAELNTITEDAAKNS